MQMRSSLSKHFKGSVYEHRATHIFLSRWDSVGVLSLLDLQPESEMRVQVLLLLLQYKQRQLWWERGLFPGFVAKRKFFDENTGCFTDGAVNHVRRLPPFFADNLTISSIVRWLFTLSKLMPGREGSASPPFEWWLMHHNNKKNPLLLQLFSPLHLADFFTWPQAFVAELSHPILSWKEMWLHHVGAHQLTLTDTPRSGLTWAAEQALTCLCCFNEALLSSHVLLRCR